MEMKSFTPAFKENFATIILSSSDAFSIYLGVCIQSIIKHASESKNYDIIVFEREISDFNKKRILSLVQQSNISIRFFNVSEAMKKFNFFLNSDRISQETYYGLLIPFLLPAYDKAIIMDCDMIVKYDISELYDTALSGKTIGGVNDIVLQGWLSNHKENDTYNYYTEYLKVKNPSSFVNGGLLLIDFSRYRSEVTVEKVSNYINNYKLRVVDQDIINMLFDGGCKHLDYRWNHLIYIKGAISEAISEAPEESQNKYFESRKAPYIIHYAGDFKPWIYPNIDFADDFWEIARTTPFYETILYNLVQHRVNEGVICHQQMFHNHFIRRYITPYREEKLKKLVKRSLPNDSKLYKYIRKVYFKLIGRPYSE